VVAVGSTPPDGARTPRQQPRVLLPRANADTGTSTEEDATRSILAPIFYPVAAWQLIEMHMGSVPTAMSLISSSAALCSGR
jgi:hypothetical protein